MTHSQEVTRKISEAGNSSCFSVFGISFLLSSQLTVVDKLARLWAERVTCSQFCNKIIGVWFAKQYQELVGMVPGQNIPRHRSPKSKKTRTKKSHTAREGTKPGRERHRKRTRFICGFDLKFWSLKRESRYLTIVPVSLIPRYHLLNNFLKPTISHFTGFF